MTGTSTLIFKGDSITCEWGHMVSRGEFIPNDIMKNFYDGFYKDIGSKLICVNGEVKKHD